MLPLIGRNRPVPALPPSEAQNRLRMVFRQFVTAFTSEDHPLVLFLDDQQWVDVTSPMLIEHLLTHPDTRYLLLVGAYRDNEVSAAHPLVTSLETIRRIGAPVMDLQLAPLSVVHLNQLVTDTLHAPPVTCEPLTRRVCERTEGNPSSLSNSSMRCTRTGCCGTIRHSGAGSGTWIRSKTKDFANNVVDLMVGKQLPIPAQKALRWAACLGNIFALAISRWSARI